MTIQEFLRIVITTESGKFCLGHKVPVGTEWENDWFNWPEDIDKIAERAVELRDDFNVYFSPYLFSDTVRIKENVLESKTIAADLDEAEITSVPKVPSVLVETSPGRSQAYWILKSSTDIETHEILSRNLTYSIPDADRSGWSLGHMFRMPNTYNWKYFDGPKNIVVLNSNLKSYELSDIELLPTQVKVKADEDTEWINSDIDIEIGEIHPLELLASIKNQLTIKIYHQYNIQAQDRSAALFGLLCACSRAGLTREQVFFLGWHSANNKFKNLKYHAKRELAKDVLRAQSVSNNKSENIRSVIKGARKLQGKPFENKEYISNIIRKNLEESGEFFHAQDESLWYIRRDSGRPISISNRSSWLDSLLDLQFGLNPSETEQTYVCYNLVNYVRNLPYSGQLASLSHYDVDTNTILLHTGRKDVLNISATEVVTITNGSYGVVFPWGINIEPFKVDFTELKEPWHEILFGMSINNVVDLSSQEALVLLRVWLLFLVLRQMASSKPILALFGQPGSGKSTLFRRLYILLYGKNRSISSVTTPDSFDFSVANDPFVVLDNVDTWEKWLPDRLALSTGTSDIVRRELYKNTEVIILKRQAIIGITAHNPTFGRADVADRLLLIVFERLKNFIPEGDIVDNIIAKRGQLWGAILKDVQKVLAEPMPEYKDIPQFRIEDFARVGYRIAHALGIHTEFSSALKVISQKQKDFNLDTENTLVSALHAFTKHQLPEDKDKWYAIKDIWQECIKYTDIKIFERAYLNPTKLGNTIWTLQDSFKDLFTINRKFDNKRGIKLWQIKKKE